MANVEHSVLTGSSLHEPKGTAAASSGSTYVANGSGSGTWQPIHQHLAVATTFDKASPYGHILVTSTTETFLSPTVDSTVNNGFTVVTSPNLRLKYTSATAITGLLNLPLSATQATGPSHDIEWALFKNGTEIVGSRAIRSIGTNTWGSITVTGLTALAKNDYIEIKTKASADAVTVNYASIYFTIIGMSA